MNITDRAPGGHFMIWIFSRILLALYLLIIIWLVLFKFRFNISSILSYQQRSLNLLPFAAPSEVNGRIIYGEMILNCLFFIPLGLLLNVNFKKPGFLLKLTLILALSLTVEIIQYIFSMGASDITDVITNTVGGFLGLKLYEIVNRYIQKEKLDVIIISVGTILLALFIYIRTSYIVLK